MTSRSTRCRCRSRPRRWSRPRSRTTAPRRSRSPPPSRRASSAQMLAASASVLTGTGVFAQNRAAFGLPPAGLGPLAAAALRRARSAPPLRGADHHGPDHEAGRPAGAERRRAARAGQCRAAGAAAAAGGAGGAAAAGDRRAAAAAHLGHRPECSPAPGRAPAGRGTAQPVPRMAPPAPPVVAGARLIVVPAAAAPRATRAAVRTRVVRNADLGAAAGPAQQQALAQAAADLTGPGVTLGAGAAHLWDLPADTGAFTLTGDGCVRMISTDRAGNVLARHRAGGGGQPGAAGGGRHGGPRHGARSPAARRRRGHAGAAGTTGPVPAPGFGVISAAFAPAGQAPAVGWQASSTLLQLGPTRFAARGATVRVPRAHATCAQRAAGELRHRGGGRRDGRPDRRRDAAAGQRQRRAHRPRHRADPTASQDGDLALGCTGGTLATPPRRAAAGSRRVLCYDVSARDPGATALTISVASARGWTRGRRRRRTRQRTRVVDHIEWRTARPSRPRRPDHARRLGHRQLRVRRNRVTQPPAQGHMYLFDSVTPPLEDGSYRLTAGRRSVIPPAQPGLQPAAVLRRGRTPFRRSAGDGGSDIPAGERARHRSRTGCRTSCCRAAPCRGSASSIPSTGSRPRPSPPARPPRSAVPVPAAVGGAAGVRGGRVHPAARHPAGAGRARRRARARWALPRASPATRCRPAAA